MKYYLIFSLLCLAFLSACASSSPEENEVRFDGVQEEEYCPHRDIYGECKDVRFDDCNPQTNPMGQCNDSQCMGSCGLIY